MKRYPYALPDRVAIFGRTYEEARHYLAGNGSDSTLDTFGMDIVYVSASAHPGSVAGMHVAKVIEVPGVETHPNYDKFKAYFVCATNENGDK